MVDGGAQFRQVWRGICEHWITYDSPQFGEEVGRLVADQIPRINVIDIRQGQQQPHRQAALIVLQKIDIAGCNAESPGHFGLGLFVLAAQLSQLRPDEGLGH